MQCNPSPLSALADDAVDDLLQRKATLMALFGTSLLELMMSVYLVS
jgi:hypothetical protein